MKIRQGFVSNSSSCSFLIYGADVTDYFNEDMFRKNEDFFFSIVDKIMDSCIKQKERQNNETSRMGFCRFQH